ncbi:MAG TPA: orotidine-5'-phosphate decarboxylase [Tepidisphaeraceae bacterium]|jgi:orotidine-5'-phosphate decarboxylase|nr:orotidine-5'-phosphate decarboxylase [Tepidisphaeraceae bacterium]
MAETFADRLLGAIEAKGGAVCVGIDPVVAMMPEEVAPEPREVNDPEASLDAVFEFVTKVLTIVAPLVPCVKFQSAYFEQFHAEGVGAYFDLIQEAIDLGLMVIGDVKRGDIGSTATAYAAGHLAACPQVDELEGIVTPDAITVNPMMGLDTLEPFVAAAKSCNKGLFVLVRTSNPGSGLFQDAKLADGRTWSELVADSLAPVAEGMVGASGYSSIGAVVGATQAHVMKSMRQRMPKSIFLLPGYGVQGATAEMTRAGFNKDGRGALVSASRSILYAHREGKYAARFGSDWQRAVEQATVDMKMEIESVLGQ